MLRSASRVCLAFDASGVCGARLLPRLRGFRVLAWARAPLGPLALRPDAREANLGDPAAVQQALAQVVAALELPPRAKVRALLPDGLARLVLLEDPGGIAAEELARFRLAPGLPYAADEAVFGAQAVGRGRLIATALRRPVSAEYEGVLRAAGLQVERVVPAPLAALVALARHAPRGPSVAVVLGDAALVLCAFVGEELRLVRSRRRERAEPGEPARLADEAARTATAAGLREPFRLLLLGPDAQDLVPELGRLGHVAEVARAPAVEADDPAAHWPWLGAAAA